MFIIIGGDGKEYGPVSVDQLQRWIAENRVNLDTRAKRPGTAEWLPLRSFSEFAPPAAATAPAGAELPPGLPPLVAPAGVDANPITPPPPERIVFTGNAVEYFKIWIVNILLTILTLGIYAAWAKVRKRRYFCANTRVFGHTFEYLADPLKILYGNLIVVGLFMVLSLSQIISPFLYAGLALLFAVAVPWFIVRALAFNARNTAWRGLRFNFTGRYGDSARAFLLWPLLVPFTFGLIFPLVAKKQKEFVVNHSAYGTTPFSFAGRTGDFYRIYGIAVLFFLPLIIGYFAFIAMMVMQGIKDGGPGMQPPPDPATLGMGGLFILAGLPFAIAGTFYLRSRIFNYVWNRTTLAGNRFAATMRARDLFLLHVVNALVTLVTFGLMHPWAAVRSAAYQLRCLELHPAGNIDAFVAAAQPPVGALGEAASDFFDLDLGFGV